MALGLTHKKVRAPEADSDTAAFKEVRGLGAEVETAVGQSEDGESYSP